MPAILFCSTQILRGTETVLLIRTTAVIEKMYYLFVLKFQNLFSYPLKNSFEQKAPRNIQRKKLYYQIT